MKQCCDEKAHELAVLRNRQGRVLWIVFGINTAMFFVELVAGLLANSTALLADSFDMFGDATVYAFTLFVLNRNLTWRTRAVRLKAAIMAVFGIGVLIEAVVKLFSATVPIASTMGTIGIAALTANLICLWLLLQHRNDDLNMRSTWLCSRNDIIANGGVLVAAALVWLTHTNWPDVLIGSAIAAVFLASSFTVLMESRAGSPATTG